MADIIRSLQDGVYRDFSDAKARTDLASEFSASDSYAAGDLVMYDGYLYKFTDTHSAGDWIGTDAVQITVGGELSSLDEKGNALESSIAIVANGDTHIAITAGQYVYVKNHAVLSEGLYTANSAIGANVALTTSNLTSVSGGGFNKINSSLASVTTEVNNIKKTTAANFPFNSGIVNQDWGSTYSIFGKIVTFTLNVRVNAAANSTTHIATFPSGARPLRKFSQNSANNDYGHFYFEIETNGNVYIATTTANPALRLSSSFIVA